MLQFVQRYDFPESLLSQPDSVMIKCANASDFDKKVKSIQPWAEQAAFMEIDTRFLVAARLMVPIALTDYRKVEWIEVMESKSSEGTSDYLGVEYAEFYHDDFNKAALLMKKKRIDYKKRVDGIHRWWNVPINDLGQELRITDKPLGEIIDRELDEGIARELRLAA